MRTLIDIFDRQYSALHARSASFIGSVANTLLYKKTAPDGDLMMKLTVGENLIRSAAFVELAFGGITTRLWDDPFEWTLAEALNDREKVLEYLGEVEATRIRGFAYFKTDDDLLRSIPAPRQLVPIAEILVETLSKAEHYQGRAFALNQTLTQVKLRPR